MTQSPQELPFETPRSGPKARPVRPAKAARPPSAARSALKFAFSPEIGRSFGSINFAWTTFINVIVQLFVSAKLINKHALDKQENIKLSHVISLAYRNLTWNRQNVRQIVLFFGVMGFLLFMFLTVLTLLMQLMTGVAMAQGPNPSTNSGDNLLNSLFNLTDNDIIPKALGSMLAVYSQGMLILGGIILLFLIVSTVMETAHSGVPFGKTFNQTWTPIRLVFAIGLLIPLSSGLNSGQYIVLNVAKWGSTLAGEAWGKFVGYSAILQGDPGTLWTGSARQTVNQIMAMETCRVRSLQAGNNINIVDAPGTANNAGLQPGNTSVDPDAGLTLSGNRVVYDEIQYRGDTIGNQTGCGTVRFARLQRLPFASISVNPNDFKIANAVNAIWSDTGEYLMHARFSMYQNAVPIAARIAEEYASHLDPSNARYFKEMPPHIKQDYERLVSTYSDAMDMHAKRAMAAMQQRIGKNLETEMNQLGWIGAPVWLHKIAQLNAQLQSEAATQPMFINVPGVKNTAPEQSSVKITGTASIGPGQAQDDVNNFLSDTPAGVVAQKGEQILQDWIDNFASRIGCQDGDSCVSNFQLYSNNPLSEIALLGQKLFLWGTMGVKALIFAAAISTVPLIGSAISIIVPIASVLILGLITAGTLMGFVVPLLPVMRFMAGILGWIMLVFQAVLAVPLVALVHLNKEGEGLSGKAGDRAYLMLLGIVVRPLLMTLGLICGLLSFNLIVKIVNLLFVPALSATFALNDMSLFHFIVMTFIYAVFIFALGNSAFKMIDIIPDQVIGWIGANLGSQGTQNDADQVAKTEAFAGAVLISKGAEPLSKAVSAVGQTANKKVAEKYKKYLDKKGGGSDDTGNL